MNNLNILSDIKKQLIERGELPQAQRYYLIDAFSLHDNRQPQKADSDRSDDQQNWT